MSPGGFARSWHDRYFVAPVRRIVAQELEVASERMATAFEEANQDLRRILGDMADAEDQVAESIGRTLTRLGAEIEVLQSELHHIGRTEPDLPH